MTSRIDTAEILGIGAKTIEAVGCKGCEDTKLYRVYGLITAMTSRINIVVVLVIIEAQQRQRSSIHIITTLILLTGCRSLHGTRFGFVTFVLIGGIDIVAVLVDRSLHGTRFRLVTFVLIGCAAF